MLGKTENPRCILCSRREDWNSVKAYEICKLSDGEPCSPCVQSIKLEEQIVAAENVLRKLLLERSNLHAEINRRHDPITYLLPPELTSRVFETCTEEDNRDWPPAVPWRPFSPLVFGAVCRPWRSTAWASPRLWTHIHFSVKGNKNYDRIGALTREWLNRSRQLPLSVSISFWGYFEGDTPHPLISLINQYSFRWKELSISCRGAAQLDWICADSKGAPALQSLSLALEQGGSRFKTSPSFITRLKSNPSRVQLSRVGLKTVDICLRHITDIHITGTYIRLDECIQILQHSPHLTDCRINGVAMESTEWKKAVASDPPVVVHHELRRFSLGKYTGNEMGMFLEILSLPALVELEVFEITDNSICKAIVALIIRSSMALLSLKMVDIIKCNSQTLVHILQNCPSLRQLRLPRGAAHMPVQKAHNLMWMLANTSMPNPASGYIETSFLPNLRQIEVYGDCSIRWDTSFWELVPLLFGPWRHNTHKLKTGRRSLTAVFVLTERRSRKENAPRILCTDKDILQRIVDLSKSGVAFKLLARSVDVLSESMQHHGISVSQ